VRLRPSSSKDTSIGGGGRIGVLRRIEDILSRIEDLFYHGSGIRPGKIMRAIEEAMELSKKRVVHKVYIPNRYTILLSIDDLEEIRPYIKDLKAEISEWIKATAEGNGYEIPGGDVIVEISSSPYMDRGEVTARGWTDEEAISQKKPMDRTRIVDLPPTGRHVSPQLVVLFGEEAGKEIEIKGPEVVIGRGNCDIRLRDKDRLVSRRHARISFDGSNFIIKDLGSKNGTFVNGKRVGECVLEDGDEITLGNIRLLFRLRRG
jgi:hypothetical protein